MSFAAKGERGDAALAIGKAELKAFYVDVIVPLESVIEKDAKMVACDKDHNENETGVTPRGANKERRSALPRRFHPRDASIVFSVMSEIPKKLVPRGTLRGTPSAVAVVCCPAAAAGFGDYWDAPGQFSGC
ncbi:hypothetical protein HPB51_002133 [Rhipicephalus microplus]|uniref:Uncharacterized protein n=1 Tax=Rhipicephalus microplus TaxID=6941 RepID=A0A9J6EPZ8_RHIMP|nr:hypothetical protein HPB51_002133 [Rhipicephalus microplus]